MTKADKKEVNELAEIWRDFYDLGKDYVLRENRRRQRIARLCLYKYDLHRVMRFWTLKAKIDKLQNKVEELEEEVQHLEDQDPFENYEPIRDESRD
jgi:cell division protein FtsB